MIKKNLIVTALFIALFVVLGQYLKRSILDYDILKMRSLQDMQKITFEFDSVLAEDSAAGFSEYASDYVAEALQEEFIAVVRPTGAIIQKNGNLRQEVQIFDMLRGDPCLKGEIIDLQNDGGGIQHSILTKLDENEEEYKIYSRNNIYYIGVKNVMRPEHTYVAFFHNWQSGDIYISDLYSLNGIFSYFKLNANDSLDTVQLNKEYTLKDIRDYEFLSSSKKTLQTMYKIKHDILNELNLSEAANPQEEKPHEYNPSQSAILPK